jgi:hypothetical protein
MKDIGRIEAMERVQMANAVQRGMAKGVGGITGW